MSSSTPLNKLPYLVRTKLCEILNKNDEWKKLAGEHMMFDISTIRDLEKKKNPTNELFCQWEMYNHTILELFILLYRMNHQDSMELLVSFVDDKYHILLHSLKNNTPENSENKVSEKNENNESEINESNATEIYENNISEANKSNATEIYENNLSEANKSNATEIYENNLSEANKSNASEKYDYSSSEKSETNSSEMFESNTSEKSEKSSSEIFESNTSEKSEKSSSEIFESNTSEKSEKNSSEIFESNPSDKSEKNSSEIFRSSTSEKKKTYIISNNDVDDPKSKKYQEVALNELSNLSKSMFSTFSSTLPKIPFKDLALVTNNFGMDNYVGKGGFAFVFKGIWKNTEVAVKRICRKKNKKRDSHYKYLEQSFQEIKLLNSLPHINILSLYAYSIDGPDPCLVYQYMENGSLDDRLQLENGTAPLNWSRRAEIAKGVALGLQYLHTAHEKPLIHRDIKSANILLDTNFVPKIGDFGLVREGSADGFKKVSRIQGTRVYLPDDYIDSKNLSTKVDTYGYGVVLLEMATGLAAYDTDKTDDKSLTDYVVTSFDKSNKHRLKDEKAGEANCHVFLHLIMFGLWCTNPSVKERPEMTTVYEQIVNDLGQPD